MEYKRARLSHEIEQAGLVTPTLKISPRWVIERTKIRRYYPQIES